MKEATIQGRTLREFFCTNCGEDMGGVSCMHCGKILNEEEEIFCYVDDDEQELNHIHKTCKKSKD